MPLPSPPPRDNAAPQLLRASGGELVWPDMLAGEDLKPSPKQHRGQRARESIVRAAQALFGQNGYEATTVEEIAKAAGSAVGGFYRHFRSKRQVLLVVMRSLLDEFDARHSARQFNESPDDALERLRQGLKTRWVNAGAYRAWREAVVRDPALAALHEAIEAVITARIGSALAIAAAAPGCRADVDVSTLALVVNVLFWRLIDTPPSERHAISDALIRLVHHALFEDACEAR
jgi:AcrR family transcriptional regulator